MISHLPLQIICCRVQPNNPEDAMRKRRDLILLEVIVLAICFVAVLVVGRQGIDKPVGGLASPLLMTPAPTPAQPTLGQPIDLNMPTTVMPPEGTPTIYHYVHVYDLAPSLDQLHKSYTVVRRADGTYDQIWHDPTDMASVQAKLNTGDKIVLESGPQILMMVHPPTSAPPTPAVSLQERSAP